MKEMIKNVYLITGAAGHLGSTIASQLIAKDCEVYGLILPGEAFKSKHLGVHYVVGDVCKPETLDELFEAAGPDPIVIHTAGIISIAAEVSDQLYEVNVNGTKNVIEACKKHGVKRLVYVSSVHAIKELPKGQTIAETDSFDPEEVVGGYARTKAMATRAVLDAANEGLDAVVVHPSGIIGPGDPGNNHIVQLIKGIVNGTLPAVVNGGYDFVDVRDVAKGCIDAAKFGKSGDCYVLSGHYSPVSDLCNVASEAAHRRKLPVLPMWLAKSAAPLIEKTAVAFKKRPLYTPYSLYTLDGNGNFSHEKATKTWGYEPRSLEETVIDTVRYLKMQPTLAKFGRRHGFRKPLASRF